MKVENFPPKVEIILQNEIPTDFYILVSGAVPVSSPSTLRANLHAPPQASLTHLVPTSVCAVQKKMEEMNNKMQDKIDDLQDLESTKKPLIYKECQSNDELHTERKVLIQGLLELLGNRTNIRLKRMGELNPKAITLYSSWQENL
ncbi:hypothetical protein PVK06_005795 [Gossypium arboreum]|uniref:Cyclic nucleotide-binding domain-containing protein n=1 Tax=Gossypium arboreum TaxID=29729 RepID=A0ABR0QVI7_GOSAR|nr:hypothetical protein PVK06_005795 [Gossypium arboreum]